MSGYETPRPEDEVTPDFEAADLSGDDRPIDPAAAKAHDVQPDDEKPVLNPDASVDPYEEANP
jgi:hypothetical protein